MEVASAGTHDHNSSHVCMLRHSRPTTQGSATRHTPAFVLAGRGRLTLSKVRAAVHGSRISHLTHVDPETSRLDLYWIPLGAGARVVRTSGRIYEFLAATRQRRRRCQLFHSALVATTNDQRVVIEMTPVPSSGEPSQRGVVACGSVGARWLGRARVFRYEVRRWPNGVIPDLNEAVASPICVSDSQVVVQRVLQQLPLVPTPVWGRDELRAGEMWNSNSVISWALAQAGVADSAGEPPDSGRAPGWDAGVSVAHRHSVTVVP